MSLSARRLSVEQVAAYRRNGYLVVDDPVLEQKHFNALKAFFAGAHQVYLAQGRDLGGNQYADPSRANPQVMAQRGVSGRYRNSH